MNERTEAQVQASAFLERANNAGNPPGSAASAVFADGSGNRAMPVWHQLRLLAAGTMRAPTATIIGRVHDEEFAIAAA